MIRLLENNGCRIQLDLSKQRLVIDVHERTVDAWERPSLAVVSPLESGLAPALYSTLAQIEKEQFVSTAMMAVKAKQFDDGLYAAVELMSQNGAGKFAGKKRLLESLCAALHASADRSEGGAAILAGAKVGGLECGCLTPEANRQLEKFLSQPRLSKPISFYTWSDQLQKIFQQDRLLQAEFLQPDWDSVVEIIKADQTAKKIYVDYIHLVAALTNPFTTGTLASRLFSDDAAVKASFVPSSVSPEYILMNRLFAAGAPFEVNVMDEIIKGLKNGTLDLTPDSNSGWYDYAIWSLAPLAVPEQMPESNKLLLGQKYKDLLLQMFKGLYALTRETHAKQLGMSFGAAPRFYRATILPKLTVEPTSSYYLRRAYGYVFVGHLLDATFGHDALSKQARMTESGPVSISLADELRQMEQLFYGAHLVSCDELGLAHHTIDQLQSEADRVACRDIFRKFAGALSSDIDLAADVRMMVPIGYDDRKEQHKVWMFLGWNSVELDVSYEQAPVVVSFDSSKYACPPELKQIADSSPQLFHDFQFGQSKYVAAYPVFAEAQVKEILNRNEFRSLCDQCNTADQVLKTVAV